MVGHISDCLKDKPVRLVEDICQNLIERMRNIPKGFVLIKDPSIGPRASGRLITPSRMTGLWTPRANKYSAIGFSIPNMLN